MITKELLVYIRAEIAKGKQREEIHDVLIAGGGWTEDDISEAFREIIPMQNASALPQKPNIPTPPTPDHASFVPKVAGGSVMASTMTIAPPSFVPPVVPPPSDIEIVSPSSSRSSFSMVSRFLKFLLIMIIIFGLGYLYWFYRFDVMSLFGN
ncbi:MAG: hypothetical protein WCT44_02440 [Candidatus Paceibacterota bacterium]